MNAGSLLRMLGVVAIVVTVAACGATRDPVVVGSFTFDESVVLAEVYAATLADAGVAVERRFDLGTRDTVAALVASGEVSVVPEYLGSLTHHLGAEPTDDAGETLAAARPLATAAGLTLLEPAPGGAANGLAVDQVIATELELTAISDLRPHAATMVLGGPPDCAARQTCLLGFENVYGLVFEEFVPLDAAGPLTRDAIGTGEIDVAVVFTTNAWIAADGLVVLDDDLGLQPTEQVVPMFNTEALMTHGGFDGQVAAALERISGLLTTAVITDLNRRVELDGLDPAEAVAGWLESVDG